MNGESYLPNTKLKTIADIIRIRQWYKNILIFAPLIFANLLFVPEQIQRAGAAFIVFCLLSSMLYIINDIRDSELDQYHPIKKNRPIPSGRITKKSAIFLLFILAVPVVILCSILPRDFSICAAIYAILIISYTFCLKEIFIVDIFAIGFGFILRVLAGSLVLGVILSPWLFTATFLIAILLGFSKRAKELITIENSSLHRKVLLKYNPTMLRGYTIITAAMVVLVYLIYTIMVVKDPYFIITTPFVLYGTFKFLAMTVDVGYDPDDMLKDWGFLLNLIIWVIIVVITLYVIR